MPDQITPDLSEGVSIDEIDTSLIGAFARSQKAFGRFGFVRLQPYGAVFPRVFVRDQRRLKEFEVRADDVWIGSFPKCGTLSLILIT